MKEAFKSYKVWIIGAILAFLGYVPFIVAVIIYFSSSAVFETYAYVVWAMMAVYLLIGFVWGDQHSASYQRKSKTYGKDVPDNVKVESWKRRLPFFLAALAVAILCASLEIYHAAEGIYPFIG